MAAYSSPTGDPSDMHAPRDLSVLTPVHRGVEHSTFYGRHLKRPLDVAGATLALAVLSPVLVAAWLALRFTLGPRVLITQKRVGLDGEDFDMYKFRTMKWTRRQAEAPFRGPERRRTHKSDVDPRHTRVGRLLRKLSIDELPQLVNVLKGDMSLVGPRPEMANVVDRYDLRHHPRHRVRPGVTGLWQVTVRQDGALLHETVDIDLEYIAAISLRGDLSILSRTGGAVLNGGGR